MKRNTDDKEQIVHHGGTHWGAGQGEEGKAGMDNNQGEKNETKVVR